MKPTLGRVVHFQVAAANQEPRWMAATVIADGPQLVLRVMVPTVATHWDHSMTHDESVGVLGRVHEGDIEVVPVGEGDGPGCWRWPPRVEATPHPSVDQSAYDRGLDAGFERARALAAVVAADQKRLATEAMERSRQRGELDEYEVHEQAMNQAASIERRIRELKP